METGSDLINSSEDKLAELCRKYGVLRLYLFGSAASERFSAESSDLDFLVEMENREATGAYADRYLGLAADLETLFGRRVDLVSEESVRNPYFRRELEATRRLVYGQSLEKASV
jgi:predicted nucleotidyltransferase